MACPGCGHAEGISLEPDGCPCQWAHAYESMTEQQWRIS